MITSKKIYVELKGEAANFYTELRNIVEKQISRGKGNSREIKLWNGIQRIIDRIEENPFYGENAKKDLVPGYYMERYETRDIWIADLPFFWRMIYTIDSTEIDITIFILDIFSHDNYNKRFGFKKR